MRRKPTREEISAYLHRVTALEKHVVLPARIAVVLSSVVSLFAVSGVDVGVMELTVARWLAIFKWAVVGYAILSVAYWVYLFRFAAKLQRVRVTKTIVFASALTDNVFLGFLLCAVMMGPLGRHSVGSTAEASLFWVYCALIVRNTLLFQTPATQIVLNSLCILGYVSALLLNVRGVEHAVLTSQEQRELSLRVVVLALLTVCSSAVYTIEQRRRRRLDEAHETAIRSQRLDIAGMLAAQVAHELKNPLSIMTNAAFLLRKSHPPLDQDSGEHLQTIEEEIDRADRIVSELLDYARLAEGKIEGVLVNESVDDSLASLQNELQARQIVLEKRYAPDLPFLFIDRGQLRQVFTNIILNACEAMDHGGKISLTTAYSGDGFIEVSIADTGKGISADLLSSIFKPFYTTKEKGTGMGLSIVQNVIRAYGGDIRAESVPGKGTTFYVRFPARIGAQKKKAAGRLRQQPHRANGAIGTAHA